MDDWKELLQEFLSEAYSLLHNLEDSLLNLEKNVSDKDQIATVFRVAHTIKGGAGAMGFDEITKLTHVMEDVLDLVRNGQYALTPDDITLLLDIHDELFKLLKARENNTQENFSRSEQLIEALLRIKNNPLENIPTNQSITPPHVLIDSEKLPLAARFCIDDSLIEAFQEGLNHGERFIFVEIDFNEEYEMKEVAPFELLAIINEFSEPIVMNPAYELIEDDFYPFLNVVFTSEQEVSYLENKLNLSEVVSCISVRQLDDVMLAELKNLTPSNPVLAPETQILETIMSEQKTEDNKSAENVAEETPKEEKKNPTLKIESSKIDELLNLLGELVIIRSGLGQFEKNLDKSLQDLRFSLRNFLSSSNYLPLNEDEDQNILQNNILRESYSELGNELDNYVEFIQQFSRISGLLQIKMMHLRMIPVQSVFSRFTRLTRDIAKQLGKKIELVIEGGETEIDKGIIDDLYDPLMHMIRNSLDHGIELPADRVAMGKPETGTVHLRAYQEGDMIFIELSDDGKGIDPEKIKRKAIEKGFITEAQAAQLSDQAAVQLITMPGFSTAEQVSNLSGRGVGMDVVIRTFEELGGSVVINSQVGFGSITTIKLPLTLAIIQGLLLLIEDIHYVIPIAGIEETIIITKDKLYPLNNYYALRFRDKLIPLIDLPHLLYNTPSFYEIYQKEEQSSDSVLYCIIVKYGSRQIGVIVPEILGEQDIVIKPIDTGLITSPGIVAATIVGNGEIGFIIDIASLIQYYLSPKSKKQEKIDD